MGPVERRVEGLPRGALSAIDSGGLQEWLPASWGLLQSSSSRVGLGRHEDPMCLVEDRPLGFCFEDVDGRKLGGCVEGVPCCDG